MATLSFGLDIERSGGTDKYDTIAIGVSVVNDRFKELDNLLLKGYFPKETVFEERWINEFWSKNEDVLAKLEYKGDKNKKEREKEMIEEFQLSRGKWERYSDKNSIKMETVSDNSVFDCGFINELIFANMDGTMPLPYCTTGNYKPLWETHSVMRGILMVADPNFKKDWGFSDRIAELYDVPPMERKHDHMPNNDAYTIAFENQVLLGIRDGSIQRI